MKIYVIKYTLYLYGTNKYSLEKEKKQNSEIKTFYYETFSEFLDKLNYLKPQIENSIYYDNLEIYIGELQKIEDIDKKISMIDNILINGGIN